MTRRTKLATAGAFVATGVIIATSWLVQEPDGTSRFEVTFEPGTRSTAQTEIMLAPATDNASTPPREQ
jgi:hypothetical protein